MLLPALAVLVLPARAPAQSKPGKTSTRSVFVKVVDVTGKPTAGLTAADFEITEGGVKRTIIKAGPATSPMRIAVLADTSDGAANAINHLRAALASFADAIAPQHEPTAAPHRSGIRCSKSTTASCGRRNTRS